jgi:phage tail sheath protein FI
VAVSYLHGLETIEATSVSGPVSTVKSNVIGVVGTAPNADPNLFPLNTPVAVFANTLMAANLKTDGTLLDAMDAIYGQGSPVVVVTRVAEGTTEAETWSNACGTPSARTGIWSLLNARPTLRVVPKLLIAPGLTSGRPSNGVVEANISAGGTGYVQSSTTVTFSAPAAGGVRATGVAQVVGGVVTGLTVTNPGFGYSAAPTVTIGGVGTGATATADLGVAPNPVGQSLAAIVDRLRAVAFLDGPGTSYADAVAYRNDFGSQRVAIIDPGVRAYDITTSQYVNKPSAAYAAGIQARVDAEKGFWYSFSNELIQNIGGPARPVDWMPNDRDSEANLLNASQVTTIIHDDGFRFWGLRSTTQDTLWQQLSVRRTADMVYESIERAERSRLDQPFSFQLLDAIQSDVNRYLTLLKTRGALIGGKAWIDKTLNTAATFTNGELTVNFDLEPPACLEHLIFQASRNPSYYDNFIEEFARIATTN